VVATVHCQHETTTSRPAALRHNAVFHLISSLTSNVYTAVTLVLVEFSRRKMVRFSCSATSEAVINAVTVTPHSPAGRLPFNVNQMAGNIKLKL